jgi:TPR repeat protein
MSSEQLLHMMKHFRHTSRKNIRPHFLKCLKRQFLVIQLRCVLGSMYLLGQGVNEDGEHAVEWLSKSLNNGYVEAGSVLGMAYVTGKAGLKIQREKGTELLKTASNAGDAQAKEMLKLMSKGVGIFAKKTPKGSRLH